MQRDNSIDFIRGVLISIVILYHIPAFYSVYPSVKWNVAFFMPAFLLVTGYLVNVRKTAGQMGLYLLRLILPYVIMVTGYCVMSYFLPVSDGVSELSLAVIGEKMFITSVGPYWFLQTIIVCGFVYYVCFRITRRCNNVVTRLIIFLGVLFAIDRLSSVNALDVYATQWYFIGVALRSFGLRFMSVFRPSFFSLFVVIAIGSVESYNNWGRLSLCCSVYCSISFLLWTFLRLRFGRLKNICLYIGRNTLPIYLFHPIFTMAAKFVHSLFAFDPLELCFTAFTVSIAVVGSLGIACLLERTRLAWIFGKPTMLR